MYVYICIYYFCYLWGLGLSFFPSFVISIWKWDTRRESSARVRAHKLIFRTGNSNVLDVGVGIY